MQQWVCTACGYNMVGHAPEICPFCGAHRDKFLSSEAAGTTYRILTMPIDDRISQLITVPELGLDHAAYRIETENLAVWIDCPSVFKRSLMPADKIFFTHRHFIGAANQYRELWQAKVGLHALDIGHPLVNDSIIDERFDNDFTLDGLAAYHIGGHTRGYTLYVYRDVLFIGDYAFPSGPDMRLNSYGPQAETLRKTERILSIVRQNTLNTVCGYDYVCAFNDWLPNFKHAVELLSDTLGGGA